MAKPNIEKWCENVLGGTFCYKTLPLQTAIGNGMDLNIFREYLTCLERGEDGIRCSSILMQKYKFKTVFLWVAFRNGRDIVNILRKYIDLLEAEMSNNRKMEERS